MPRVPNRPAATSAPILDLRHASLVREHARVLHDLNLAIHHGEHVAIVGPNGAGKSSLIRLLTLEAYPVATANDEPPLRLFGRVRWDATALRARMGVVSADVHERFTGGPWVSQVPAIEVVLSGFFASRGVFDHHEVTEQMREQARAALARVGALHLAASRLDRLSTGEARRVLIARALVRTPDLLVLDEPTTGLDIVARHRFMEHVRQAAHEGTTILLVTQHVDEIIPEIGRVIVLKEGRIIDDGPTARVLLGPALPEAFGGPVRVACEEGYYYVRPGPLRPASAHPA
ncbi:MAG: ATP-binding cassette domain-containing protein [Acidobacteria bacterium]|nr:ATP-binding cassette domain-containing protein [Acidobacteriota bacterium]